MYKRVEFIAVSDRDFSWNRVSEFIGFHYKRLAAAEPIATCAVHNQRA